MRLPVVLALMIRGSCIYLTTRLQKMLQETLLHLFLASSASASEQWSQSSRAHVYSTRFPQSIPASLYPKFPVSIANISRLWARGLLANVARNSRARRRCCCARAGCRVRTVVTSNAREIAATQLTAALRAPRRRPATSSPHSPRSCSGKMGNFCWDRGPDTRQRGGTFLPVK